MKQKIETLKELFEHNKLIYVDMDGTLTAFQWNGKIRVRKWDGIFENAMPIQKHVDFIKKLSEKYSVAILSHYPTPESVEQKKRWLKEQGLDHLGHHFVPLGKKKSYRFDNTFNMLLIDDQIDNLVEWEDKGGKALHVSTLAALIERDLDV